MGTEEGLKQYDHEGDLVLQTSGVVVDTTILQTNEKGFLQPIASRILNKAERNYPQIERELLGVTKFRLFVLGRKFFVRNRQ